ncbi:hypothetical protein FACS189459_0600 [Bacilli bacterium]|nr:hypothetical protein FACS189459_0600 [Bacilli bacterium]
MVVFYIVAMFNIPSPATLANKKETEIFSYSYINKNGKMANAVSFSPTIDFKHGMIANNMQNVQDEKKF